MNKIYYSPKEVFEKRFLEVGQASSTGKPIYTPETYQMYLAVDEDMQRRLGHSQLVHKADETFQADLSSEYTPTSYHATYNSIIRKMPDANKDEIYIFLATASPEKLSDEEIQVAMLTRLADIQKRELVTTIVEHQDASEMAQEHASEVGAITSYLGAMKNAVKVEGSYFAEGYTLDTVQDSE